MAEKSSYIIRGGVEGWERLRILSRVMRPTSLALLQRAGVRPGMACLEVGCGGGDLAFDLAKMVGPAGRVVATDIDKIKLELARADAEAQQLCNIEFCLSDITQDDWGQQFDLVHARFVLTHLPSRRRGGDANIGSRLPGLLAAAGFHSVQMNIVQAVGVSGM